ncbi:MAG TPA: family 16 glycoside hydrolase [Lacipirellulaceae bacterium]|jgi:hypothetical protein|nr:family 16 glycoside hydrolase [Lacipirellulaceae bacterium]
MKTAITFALIALSVTFAAPITRAADTGPVMAQKGKLLFSDDFARPDTKPKWHIFKGSFTVKDGVVTIVEIPSDNHPAALQVAEPLAYKDFVAEFSVKFDGGKSCSLMINDKGYKDSHAGHICKATISAGKGNVADQKYGTMREDIYEKMQDPKTTAEEKKKLRESIKDLSRDFKNDIDLSSWHLMRVEVVGEEILASLDGRPVAYMKAKGIDHPTKTAMAIQATGKSVEVKDFKVWEATAASDWAAKGPGVVGSLK